MRQIAGSLSCRVGGGIRTTERVPGDVLAAGARQIIAGSSLFKAIGAAGSRFRQRARRTLSALEQVIAAVDSRAGSVVIHGWKTTLPLSAVEAIRALEPYCGEFLYTHVDAEGLMRGTDLNAILARCTQRHDAPRHSRPAGITTQQEIDELGQPIGGRTPVVGMALYTRRSEVPGSLGFPRVL